MSKKTFSRNKIIFLFTINFTSLATPLITYNLKENSQNLNYTNNSSKQVTDFYYIPISINIAAKPVSASVGFLVTNSISNTLYLTFHKDAMVLQSDVISNQMVKSFYKSIIKIDDIITYTIKSLKYLKHIYVIVVVLLDTNKDNTTVFGIKTYTKVPQSLNYAVNPSNGIFTNTVKILKFSDEFETLNVRYKITYNNWLNINTSSNFYAETTITGMYATVSLNLTDIFYLEQNLNSNQVKLQCSNNKFSLHDTNYIPDGKNFVKEFEITEFKKPVSPVLITISSSMVVIITFSIVLLIYLKIIWKNLHKVLLNKENKIFENKIYIKNHNKKIKTFIKNKKTLLKRIKISNQILSKGC